MRVGTGESLIDAKLVAYVEESRAFYVARAASRVTDSPPDPSTPEGLREVRALEEARAKGAVSAMSPGPPVVEALAEVTGRQVPVRVLAPEGRTARGVYLDIHGGGFYMGVGGTWRRVQSQSCSRPRDRCGERGLPAGPRASLACRTR
jgi:acetyl esterase/lipase